MIAGAAALSAVLLTAGGFALSEIFRSAVQEGFDDQLTFDLDGLIAAAESDAPGHVTFENRFADPRFERIVLPFLKNLERIGVAQGTGVKVSNQHSSIVLPVVASEIGRAHV